MAGRAVLVGTAIIGGVQDAPQVDRVRLIAAVRARPKGAVAFRAGRFPVFPALQGLAVAGRAVVDRPAKTVGVQLSAPRDGVIEPGRRVRPLAGADGIFEEPAGE